MTQQDAEWRRVEGMGGLLARPELDAEQKQLLIGMLLEFKDKLGVGQLLAEGISSNQDAAVVQELVEALDKLGDKSLVPALVPLLSEPEAPLAPLAPVVLRVMRHLDPRTFVETLAHPGLFPAVVSHRDFFLRLFTAKQADTCVDLLVEHHRDPEKRLSAEAVECLVARGQLEVAPMAWERLSRGSDYKSFAPLGEVLEHFLDVDLIRELVSVRRFAAAPESGDLEATKLRVKRLTTVEKLLKSACEKFDIDPRTLDEQAFDWQTSALYEEKDKKPETPGEKEPPPGAKEAAAGKRATRQSRTVSPRARPTATAPVAAAAPSGQLGTGAMLLVGVIVVLGLLRALFGGGGDGGGGEKDAPVVPSAGGAKKGSPIGETGDVVSVSGKILQIYTAQKSFTLLTANSVMAYVTFRSGFPKPIRGGQEVHVTGTITEVKTRTNVYVAGAELVVAP